MSEKQNRNLNGIPSELVCDIIREERGLLSYVAERLSVRKSRLRTYINNRQSCITALAEAREDLLDRTEKKLYEQIDAGERWAIIYYLSTQGKSRGYISPNSKTGAYIGDTNNLTVTAFNIIAAQPSERVPLENSVKITERLAIEHDDRSSIEHDDDDIDLAASEPEPAAISALRQQASATPWFRPIDDESDDR